MAFRFITVKEWAGTCPSCDKVVLTNKDIKCENCRSDSVFKYPAISKKKFESDYVYFSWFGIHCRKGCGWTVNILVCPECDAKIQGRYLNHLRPLKYILEFIIGVIIGLPLMIGTFIGGMALLFLLITS